MFVYTVLLGISIMLVVSVMLVNLKGLEAVGIKDFELLKVLGTGGTYMCGS
jgi:hypothetical protein